MAVYSYALFTLDVCICVNGQRRINICVAIDTMLHSDDDANGKYEQAFTLAVPTTNRLPSSTSSLLRSLR